MFLFSVVIDRAENRKALTGKFECIYRQPMTLPVQFCDNNANNLVINGVAIPSHYLCKESEEYEAVKRERNRKENTQKSHNVEHLNEKKFENKTSEQPVLNLLQKLASLFELAVMKESDDNVHLIANQGKNSSAHIRQMYPESKRCNNNHMPMTSVYKDTHTHKDTDKIEVREKVTTKPNFEDYLKENPYDGASTLEIQTNSSWITETDFDDNSSVNRVKYETCADSGCLTVPHSDDHLDIDPKKRPWAYDIQTESSLMTEHGNDDFGYYNYNIDRDKKTNFYMTQTESNPMIKPNNNNHIDKISNKKKNCKIQKEPNAVTKSDYGDYLDVHSMGGYNI